MDLPVTDYATARNFMVDGQLRPNRVTDPRIIHAMRQLPREAFLPPQLAAMAYADEDVPLGGGRVLMEPMVLARLIQSLLPRPGQRALVAACGTGFGAAVLAATGARVTAMEDDEALLAIAGPALAAHAPGVRLVRGPVDGGCADGAPWDLVLIEGAVPAIPAIYAAQLAQPAGRLATVVLRTGRTANAVLAEVSTSGLASNATFDCATPVLPALAAKPAFRF